ncbi:MAG: O-antigen ligase family protein [Bacteroidales bacterium]|nr:O-antigen ligase family protein [Bacteroidales bacterium]
MKLFEKINYFLFVLLAFFIPTYRPAIPFIIGLLVLVWILEFDFRKKFKRLTDGHNRLYLLSFALLYVLYLIGILYSSNVKYAVFDLEVKLSLIIFPIIFSTINKQVFTKNNFEKILVAFIIGCFIGTAVSLVDAYIIFCDNHQFSEFYYSKLSFFHHPSYFAMYLNFAIAIIISILLKKRFTKQNRKSTFLLMLLIIYFSLFVIMLSSKAGILGLFILFFITVAHVIIVEKQLVAGLFLVVIIFGLFYASFNIFPCSLYRIVAAKQVVENIEKIENDDSDGSASRILIWQNSVEIINENFLIGVGTGDVKDCLVDKYKENNIKKALIARSNAHNQYLQTFVTLGIIGFLILSLSLVLPAYYTFRHKHFLYLLFLIIFSINLLVESMLETQAGVVFYAFFNSFLFFMSINESRSLETA